ncbi:MAG: hypothetical protein ACREJC_16260, partial [Tepidisphaeraceae bacterium]
MKQPAIAVPTSPSEPRRRDLLACLVAPATFALLTVLMFGDVLVRPDVVVSSPNTDLKLQFVSWRQFGFEQLRSGDIPLWNPHIYGGAPYFAGFQAALLYPPNWLHLLLPLGVAINWIVALHVFLMGYFTYLWCRRRASVAGSILAGIMTMFAGPYFLHTYAGHLPHVCVIPWIPLILLALDGLCESGESKWCLLGVAAIAMQILAGHPQYVYYTGIATGAYLPLRMIDAKHRGRALAGFVGMWAGAALVTAMQLLPGIAAADESVRSGGLPRELASTVSLPPENFLTWFVPNLFGTLQKNPTSQSMPYFGRGYLWEMSLFVSTAGL